MAYNLNRELGIITSGNSGVREFLFAWPIDTVNKNLLRTKIVKRRGDLENSLQKAGGHGLKFIWLDTLLSNWFALEMVCEKMPMNTKLRFFHQSIDKYMGKILESSLR